MLAASASQGDSCLTSYEDYNCRFLDTKAHCASEGITFIPMVVEGHSGGWGPAARRVWSQLAKGIALVSGEQVATEAVRALQNLGLTLHKESARAILRRAPDPGHSGCSPATQVLARAAGSEDMAD